MHWYRFMVLQFSSVQSLSRVWLFATPWTAACQISLSSTNSRSLLKFMSIKLVTPSNHLVFIISTEYSLEGLMLKLKLQYFGHLLWRTDSLEKTLMLGKIEGRRRRGWQDEMVLQINIKFGLQAKRAYVILLMSASGKYGRFPKSSPCSSQLEKAHPQQQRPSAAKNKYFF